MITSTILIGAQAALATLIAKYPDDPEATIQLLDTGPESLDATVGVFLSQAMEMERENLGDVDSDKVASLISGYTKVGYCLGVLARTYHQILADGGDLADKLSEELADLRENLSEAEIEAEIQDIDSLFGGTEAIEMLLTKMSELSELLDNEDSQLLPDGSTVAHSN